MLATHVWRTHEVWADEYRAYFGLSAKRGLVGTDTSAKLRAAATEYLVPHHDAAVELARAATRGQPLRERGPRIRLETRLDPAYRAAARNRGLRSAEIMQERLKDPDQRDRLQPAALPRTEQRRLHGVRHHVHVAAAGCVASKGRPVRGGLPTAATASRASPGALERD
jgi:hypothetical protein